MADALQPVIPLGPDLREEAVQFPVGESILWGNVTRPASEAAATGVVMVHGWSGYRNGPNGLLTAFCRRLGAAGYPSFRFDFRGRGESQGDGLAVSLPSMADDLVAASAWFARRCGVRRIVYVGICSGGNVAVGSLGRLPLACGLVLLSVYPFSDGDAFGRDVHRTWHYARIYLHKALRRETWERLVKGEVHPGRVLHVLFGHFLRRGRNRRKEEGTAAEASGPAKGSARPVAAESRKQDKPPPVKHLANLKRTMPCLMLYGTADPDAPAALRYFGDYAREQDLPISFVRIEGANHNFSSREWKEQVAGLAEQFCRESIGV
ncbi:MAG: alpha/beta fold hydrolase [Lentisphaeria bacterium]|nr:alpha/beta fold hydrolase [Lentisphaeria bacterium]